MKKMNRVISLAITFAIITLSVVVPASADTTPSLIYDMEISNGQIINSVEGGQNLFAINNTSNGTVGFSSFNGIFGNVSYVAMANTTSSIKYSTTDENLLGESYTLEAWIQPERLNTSVIGYPFMSINSDSANSLPNDDISAPTQATANVAVGFYNSSNKFNAETGNCEAMLSWHRQNKGWQYASNWMHSNFRRDDWIKVTLVREVVRGESQDTIKKRLYINGTNEINGVTTRWNEWSYTTAAPFTDELLSFNIGSYHTAYEKMNVADIKLYAGVKTATDILSDYNNEKNTYKIAEIINTAPVESDIQIAALGITEIEPGATLKGINTNEIISANCSIDSGVISVTPTEYLSYATRYLLEFDDPNLKSYVVVTKEHPISVGEISLIGSELSIPLTNSLSAAKDITIIVISVGETSGAPVLISSDVIGITNTTQILNSTAKVNVSQMNGTGYKILVLEREGELFRPVCMPIQK